jgi:hypothetical protein
LGEYLTIPLGLRFSLRLLNGKSRKSESKRRKRRSYISIPNRNLRKSVQNTGNTGVPPLSDSKSAARKGVSVRVRSPVFLFRACPGDERRVRLSGGSVRGKSPDRRDKPERERAAYLRGCRPVSAYPDPPTGAPLIRHAGYSSVIKRT